MTHSNDVRRLLPGDAVSTGPVIETYTKGPDLMMVKSLVAAALFGGFTTAAAAIDTRALMPCKPAAARYCDRSDISASMGNLLRCGATLAANSERVGEPCRVVLRRYGQL